MDHYILLFNSFVCYFIGEIGTGIIVLSQDNELLGGFCVSLL